MLVQPYRNNNLTTKTPKNSHRVRLTFAHLPPGDGGDVVLQSSHWSQRHDRVRHQYGVVQVHMEDQLLPLVLVWGPELPGDRPRRVRCPTHRLRDVSAVRPVVFFRLTAAVLTELRHDGDTTGDSLKMFELKLAAKPAQSAVCAHCYLPARDFRVLHVRFFFGGSAVVHEQEEETGAILFHFLVIASKL